MISEKELQDQKVAILRKELERRQQKNAGYSLRSFARDLSVSHTLLSMILNGKRPVTDGVVEKFLEVKNVTISDRQILRRKGIPEDAQKKHKVSLDQFAMISDWVCYGILSLLETGDFQWNEVWIGERLNITPTKAKSAMDRLVRLNYIEKTPEGKYRQSVQPIVVENLDSTLAAKSFNQQLLKKAQDSMEYDGRDFRDLSSIIFAMDPSQVPYAVQRIRQFRRELCGELEKMENKKEVYAIAVQLFPLSKIGGRK